MGKWVAVLALALVVGACSGSDSGDGGEAAPTTTTTEVTAGVAVEASGVSDVLGDADTERYLIDPAGNVTRPDAAGFPIEPGSVTAHWYRADGRYVVVFAGFDGEARAACPQTALLTTDREFLHKSAAPSAPRGCKGVSPTPRPVAGSGPRLCGSLLLYGTDIPDDAEGALNAVLDVGGGNAGYYGIFSLPKADKTKAPELDVTADAYTVPEGFLPGGATEVTCS